MLEILSYWFFQKALIAGIIVSLTSWVLWSLVVLRREPNITHSIANILFLWIIVSFFFSGNYYIFGIMFALLGVLILTAIERFSTTSRESSKEIISQIWLAWGIFLVGILWNLQLDVFNFLFWNILFIDNKDIISLLIIWFIGIILWVAFKKEFIQSILSPEIAITKWVKTHLLDLIYMVYLALFIAVSIKMFWALLLWAFLVLPGNIGRLISKNFYGVFMWSTVISIISVCIWLFGSYFFDTSAGATIVLLLWTIFLGGLFFSKNN